MFFNSAYVIEPVRDVINAPFLNISVVGALFILKLLTTFSHSSMSTLNAAHPASSESLLTKGSNTLHGAHQVAPKTTITMPVDCKTVVLKLLSDNSSRIKTIPHLLHQNIHLLELIQILIMILLDFLWHESLCYDNLHQPLFQNGALFY